MPPEELDGQGKWENRAILARYRDWCRRLSIHPGNISPRFGAFAERGWACAMIEQIIAATKRGDRAAASIAIEFIEEDGGFAFGRILKANCARELRRVPLDEEQKQKIRARVVAMLERGFLPSEFSQYEKLLRRVGAADFRARIEACLTHENPWVRWRAARLLGDFSAARPGPTRLPL